MCQIAELGLKVGVRGISGCPSLTIVPKHANRPLMADVHTPEQRSFNMSRIRSKNTKPELVVRKFLFSRGFRYRLHNKKLPGKPDIVLARHRLVIFIHGCFWHGHNNYKYFVIPKTRTEWWLKKINRNKALDAGNIEFLKKHGWRILTVFECELKPSKIEKTLKRIINFI